MTVRGATIVGTGHYAPEQVLTNRDLERLVDTSDQWIRDRTGIRERRVAAPDEAANVPGEGPQVRPAGHSGGERENPRRARAQPQLENRDLRGRQGRGVAAPRETVRRRAAPAPGAASVP